MGYVIRVGTVSFWRRWAENTARRASWLGCDTGETGPQLRALTKEGLVGTEQHLAWSNKGYCHHPPPPPSSLDIIIALARSFWLPWMKMTHYQSSASLAREQNAMSSNSDQRSNPDYLIRVSTWWPLGQCAKCFFFTYAIFEIFDFFHH